MCFITLLLPIFLLNSSFNLINIVVYQNNYWNCFVFFPLAIYFFIILLAETNRTPFDLPEAEAELVAGYNLEYSAINFALFFLGEYTNMLLNSAIFVIFFLGGWLPFFFLKNLTFFIGVFFFLCYVDFLYFLSLHTRLFFVFILFFLFFFFKFNILYF
jgi:NADH-quinone oxidoreductase subunit H